MNIFQNEEKRNTYVATFLKYIEWTNNNVFLYNTFRMEKNMYFYCLLNKKE
jgi:hypothetical protein